MSSDSRSEPTLTGAIFEAAVDGIIVIDELGVMRAVNGAAQRMFGYAEDELTGRNVSMLMPADDAHAHDGYIRAYHHTGERRIIGIGREVIAQRRDGSRFPMYLSIGEYATQGERRYVGICHDATERRHATERIAYLARHDSLTDAINRSQFIHALDERIDQAHARRAGLATLFIDLDGFKQVNDRHGHGVGDLLLREIVARMQETLQPADIIGRVGGDEFAVVLPGAQDAEQAESVAARLLATIAAPIQVEALTLTAGASIGISLFPEHGRGADELMNAADIAMYQAKQAGGGIRGFEPRMRARKDARYRMVEKLRAALLRGEFHLHYQPQFDLDTLEPCGMEALLRWHTAQGEAIAPQTFIPLAIEYGLMPQISRWVLRQACTDNAALIAQGLLDAPVAVNLCLPTLAEPDFIELLHAILRETGLPGDRLEIEITEDIAMAASPLVLRHAANLREIGVGLAMDDFGIGFSSLGRLKTLHFGKIKIDRSFVAGLPSDPSDDAIVRSMCGISAALGMQVLAEGVETAEQLACLRAQGCQQGQGYWYARPMPLPELADFLSRQRGGRAGSVNAGGQAD